MGPTGVDAFFLDTNVLLSATMPARALHARAIAILNEWPRRDVQLLLSGQVLREYLVVATRPVSVNGLGLDRRQALDNLEAIRARSRILEETRAVADRLASLMYEVDVSGRQIHDANIVATMLVHGADAMVTENVVDFERFGDHVRVMDLAGVEVP